MKPVSLSDVAQLAGVSRMTASRALRGCRNVSAKTQDVVKKAAEALGWCPNPEVSKLMESLRLATSHTKAQTIALIWPDATLLEVKNFPTLRCLYHGISHRSQTLGFHLESFFIKEQKVSDRQLNRMLTARGIESVIIAPVSFESRLETKLDWERYSCIVIGAGFEAPPISRVHNNHYLTLQLMLQKLKTLGYENPVFMLSRIVSERLERIMEAAFVTHFPRDGKEAFDNIFYIDDHNEKSIIAWIQKKQPDVVICEMANPVWLLKAFEKLKLRVPKDVGYCSFNVNEDYPHTTGMNQQFEKMGSIAVDSVVSRFIPNERGIPEIGNTLLTTPIWVSGKTCRKS